MLGGLLLLLVQWTWTWDGGESGKKSEETYFVISECMEEDGWLRDYPVGRASCRLRRPKISTHRTRCSTYTVAQLSN